MVKTSPEYSDADEATHVEIGLRLNLPMGTVEKIQERLVDALARILHINPSAIQILSMRPVEEERRK